MRTTCPKSDYLESNPEILALCKEVLVSSELAEAEELAMLLASSKADRKKAVIRLKAMIAPGPYRPVFYLLHEIEFLPRWTRDSVRYLGDYVDYMVKYYTADKLKNNKYKEVSLGGNLKALKTALDQNLHRILSRYDQLIYKPAKHQFTGIKRPHLFTSKDVVFITFLTMRLVKEFINMSALAKAYYENKVE